MKVPTPQYHYPPGRLQLQTTDLDAVKGHDWWGQHILVVSASDERLDFIKREIVHHISGRLCGGARHG